MVLAILGIVLILALTGGLTMLLVADAQAVAESSRRMSAFFLAESGFEAAKFEIGEAVDPGNDGPGNVSATKADGSYSVTVTDLGNDRYELTSTGTSRGTSVRLKMVTARSSTSKFPPSALAVLGPSQATDLSLSVDVSLDGGDSPAILLTDEDKFDAFGAAITAAASGGGLLGQITGAVTTLLGSLLASLQFSPSAAANAEICDEVYTTLLSRLNGSVLPSLTGTSLPGGSTVSYGSVSTPATIYLNARTDLLNGQSLTGHGTLIITDELRVPNNASIDWNGNLIVLAAAGQDARMEIDGDVTVNGSVVLVGRSGRLVSLDIDPGGSLTVNGALNLLADYTSGGKVNFESDGPLHVDGLFQALGVEHKINFKNTSQLILNGQMGLGPAMDLSLNTKLELKLDGLGTIFKDAQEIVNGATALAGLDQVLGAPVFSGGLTQTTMTTEAWWPDSP